ncbi:uncharacterized protein LOC116843656 [Odontomachus brunneus]|uniref:uncharacterized protein LOC116843656 n=1 Tax=Odontomachus brunneus TaxID=486640 RepID=UPI0013F255FB|nr:uncharacterized protein LOC116843656 [Odontomachus brunneus]XP_032670136.1 uncharacterized protein LOC116843656 [Odontomachus brunneus]
MPAIIATPTTMEMDANINDILCEVITFLECLRDAQLQPALESLREKLLQRSKNTLSAIKKTSSSPEPYLDMNSGPKTILLTKNENDTEEYVGMEESPQKQNHQDYYETFEHESQPKMVLIAAENVERARSEQDNEEGNQALMNIYKNLSAAQSKSKCHKCGPLHRKEGKKLFMPENRACWVALVGSHLLIYRNERHARPGTIYPIRGYMARPAPNLLPRDQQKSDSAFEIFCPGNETLQFIARTSKDMHQWVAKICEVGCGNEDEKDLGNKSNASNEASVNHCEDNATSPRRHKTGKSADNVKKKSPAKSKTKSKARKDTTESPPSLPTRIPRRLPSIPTNDSVPSHKPIEIYDDNDDIYYRIDELNGRTAYQNVMLAKNQCINVGDNEHGKAAGYDDVCASKGEKESQVQEEKSAVSGEEKLYDDIFEMSRIKASTEEEKVQDGDRPIAVDDGEESVYDDVENLLGKSTKDRVKDQIETSSKFLQKKSFLKKVWSRKESPGKTEKRLRGKVSSSPIPSSLATEVMSTYDDVSDLMSHPESLADNGENELPEYNCPPPPRPVYTKSPSIVNQVDPNPTGEFYDDISACREQHSKNNQQTILQSTQESCASVKEAKNDATELRTNGELPEEEIEHYQSPRSDLCIRDAPEYQNEDLYDDIALSVNFKVRQRDTNEKRDSEDSKSMISFDTKSWNRFTVNRNRRSGEPACLAETNRRNTDDSEEFDDSTEANGTSKRNTFQKLISRMENSLAKVSVRGPTSLPMNKPNTVNNNS